MITVHKIELINFRSIPYAVIEPNIDGGMTALAGSNGMGKSSVVHGLLWAMWGITPADVSVRGLRKQGTDGAECRVTVTFEHDGQIVEATRALKGKNDTTVAFIKVDGVEITNVSAKTAVAWMENRLGGLDAAGFLTAFVVRQKEMDDLVRARPAERKKLIERLAGIERMSEAVQRARETENEAKKLINLLPGSEQELANAITLRDEILLGIQDLKNTEGEARVDAEDAQKEADRLDKAYRAAREALNKHDELEKEKSEAENQIAVLTANKDAADRTLEEKSKAAEGGDVESLSQRASEYEAAQSALTEARSQAENASIVRGRLESLAKSAKIASETVSTNRSKVEGFRANLALAKEDALSLEVPSPDVIQSVENALEKARTERADAQAEYRRLNTAISTLSDSSHPNCPTCNRDLENPETVIGAMQVALDTVTSQGRTAKESEETLTTELTAHKSIIEEARKAAENIKNLEEKLSTAESDLLTAQTQYDDLQGEIQEASDLIHQADGISPESIKSLESAAAEARDAHLAAKRAAEAASEIPTAQAKVTEYALLITEKQNLVKDLVSKIISIGADPAGTFTLEESAREARNRVSEANATYQEAKSGLALANNRLEMAENAVQSEQERLNAKADAITSYQRKTATREALEAFRMDRLARIAPELAEVTTDLVARMTNGRYVAVDMDENFTPILTDETGEQRPASWLSGGEESVVALALRIGIGEVISGSRGGLLVLDEVLTAQDADRRQAMMSAIRDLPGRQILMINHVAEALDIADKGYLFVQDEDGDPVVVDLAHEQGTIHLEHVLDPD